MIKTQIKLVIEKSDFQDKVAKPDGSETVTPESNIDELLEISEKIMHENATAFKALAK